MICPCTGVELLLTAGVYALIILMQHINHPEYCIHHTRAMLLQCMSCQWLHKQCIAPLICLVVLRDQTITTTIKVMTGIPSKICTYIYSAYHIA